MCCPPPTSGESTSLHVEPNGKGFMGSFGECNRSITQNLESVIRIQDSQTQGEKTEFSLAGSKTKRFCAVLCQQWEEKASIFQAGKIDFAKLNGFCL